jgi:hypothetical protein
VIDEEIEDENGKLSSGKTGCAVCYPITRTEMRCIITAHILLPLMSDENSITAVCLFSLTLINTEKGTNMIHHLYVLLGLHSCCLDK